MKRDYRANHACPFQLCFQRGVDWVLFQSLFKYFALLCLLFLFESLILDEMFKTW